MNPPAATKKSFAKPTTQKPTLKPSKTTLSLKISPLTSNASSLDQIFGSNPETPVKLLQKPRGSDAYVHEPSHKSSKSILPHHPTEIPSLPTHTRNHPSHHIENPRFANEHPSIARSHTMHKTAPKDCKSSKELVLDVKKCIEELKEEASLYIDSGKRKIKSSGCHLKKTLETSENPDSLETESKDSFVIKTPASNEASEDQKKTPALSGKDIVDIQDRITVLMRGMNKNGHQEEEVVVKTKEAPVLTKSDIADLKEKMDLLMMKMSKSDEQAQMHKTENLKLKEAVKDLEERLETVKMFHEPMNMSCNGKCDIV